jgi:rhodanese-related sulfurtransferase
VVRLWRISKEGLRVSAQQVREAMDSGKSMVILDVRAPHAWEPADSQAAGSVRMPLTDFEAHADELPRDRQIVAYCT